LVIYISRNEFGRKISIWSLVGKTKNEKIGGVKF
jgi:hypothetical protein